jgi:hypothetical protein
MPEFRDAPEDDDSCLIDGEPEADSLNKAEEDGVMDDEQNSFFPKHFVCYAHSFQLVFKDGFKSCGRKLQKASSKTVIIVNHVRR